MTNEQRALIATKLAGYEVQVSPAGKWYVVTGDETKPMPDFSVDEPECTSTADAICKSRSGSWSMGRDRFMGAYGRMFVGGFGVTEYAKTPCAGLAKCLLKICEE